MKTVASWNGRQVEEHRIGSARRAIHRTTVRRRGTTEQGLTLIELMIVIAIIGTLVSLLLPAAQSSREAARRAQCTNHLRQLALATLNHESALKFYPTGGWDNIIAGNADRGAGIHQPAGLFFNILPYIEQKDLYGLTAGKAKGPSATIQTAVTKMLQTPVPLFYCPSRRECKCHASLATDTIWCGEKGSDTAITLDLVAKNDYAANGGSEWINLSDLIENAGLKSTYSANLNNKPVTTIETFLATPADLAKVLTILESGGGETPAIGYTAGANTLGVDMAYPGANGISYTLSAVRAAQITDGTSNTCLIGEKYQDPAGYESAVSYKHGDYAALTSATNSTRRVANGIKYSISKTASPRLDSINDHTYHGFGSVHHGAFNMAFCDGSVRTVSYGIADDVHNSLANRRDGKTIDINELDR